MSDFRQNFLAESIDSLHVLQKELGSEMSARQWREAFRTIHSIKGGAQTFGLEDSARLAHELENVLSAGEQFTDKYLLLEGIHLLANSLGQNEPESSADFLEKLKFANQTTVESDVLFTRIPSRIFKNFSEQERRATVNALRRGKSVFCAEVEFETTNFAADYRELRKILSEKSEIIASLPSETPKPAGVIGFQIFLASSENADFLQVSLKNFRAVVSSHACVPNRSSDLYKMLSHVASYAERIAEKSGKEIRVCVLANDAPLSAPATKSFFDILAHLVRNAVDHGIKRAGTIEIQFFVEAGELYLSVGDDGRGIDAEKLRRRAIEQKLISAEDSIDERETLELVFAPGFSTAERVTETSGRGVGLDAVKAAVEKMNGKIFVHNRKTKGAMFEITVPREKR